MPRKSKEEQRKEDLLALKQVLLEQKNKILDHLKKIEQESTSGLNAIGGDDADIANLELSQRTSARIGNRERKLLDKIQYALDKFGEGDDTGTYGICEHTGEDIPTPRLQARPVAKLTVEAKQELERREAGYHDLDDEDEFSLADD